MSRQAQLPDGTVLEFPDETPDAVIDSTVKQHLGQTAVSRLQDFVKSNPSEYDPMSAAYQAKYGATSGNSFGENALAGAGKAFVDMGRGIGQKLGLESRADIQSARERDAPLMRTGGGIVGNMVGNVAATAPALAIPGANTVAGAAAIGAGLGYLQPSVTNQESALNIGVGMASGAAGQWLGNKVANAVDSKLASNAASLAHDQSLNSARDAVLKQARAAGYVVPPTAANPSMTATALESVSGKAATRQAAQAVNARVTNRIVAQDLGLAADKPITQAALQGVRDQAGKVYQAIKGTGTVVADQPYLAALQKVAQAGTDLESAYPGIGAQANEQVQNLVKSLSAPQADATQSVAAFRFLNEQAKNNFKAAFQQGGNQQALELARAQSSVADALGDLIQRNVEQKGYTGLGQAWQQARQLIAKSYTAEAALKGGNVNAVKLAAQLQKRAPLTGGFRQAAEFADMFEDVARLPKSGAGVSKLAATIGGTGALTSLMYGHPLVAAGAAGATAIPYAIRQGLLSRVGQAALATPKYTPNALATAALTGTGAIGRYGMLPAYLAGQQLVQAEQQDAP